MARFIDILLREKLVSPLLPKTPVIVADGDRSLILAANLAKGIGDLSLWHEESRRRQAQLKNLQFNPPFSRFWLECKDPGGVVAFYVTIADPESLIGDPKFYSIEGALKQSKWVYSFMSFLLYGKYRYRSSHMIMCFVDQDGRLIMRKDKDDACLMCGFEIDHSAGFDGHLILGWSEMVAIMRLLHTIAQMNCVNIELEERNPPLALSKSHQKKYRIPMSSWYELRLKTKRYAKAETDERTESGDRQKMREHLVRGHFKRRASGVFWWSSFVRGGHDLGTIVKSYKLSAEDAQA